MKSTYLTVLQAFALTGALMALDARPGVAQDAPAGMDVLIELAQNDAAQDVLGLSGSELAAAIATASDAQLSEFFAALSPEDLDGLLAALTLSGSAAGVISAIVFWVIENDPEATDRVINVVLQNSAPVALPPIAAVLVEDAIGKCASIPEPVLEGIVLAAVSFDRRSADQIVRLGNASGEDCTAMLGRVLARISETAEEGIASAIETALALEGGVLAQLVSEIRGEVDVAAIPDQVAAPAPPATLLVGPAAIGGGGSTPGATSGSDAGQDAIFAAGGGVGGGIGGGPVFTPPGQPFTPPSPPPSVSPVN